MAKKIWERLTPIEKDAISQGANLLGELRDKVAPAWRERSGEGAQNLSAGRCLRELREARQISQEELAARLERTQSAISQIEKRGDLLLSTFTQYVEANRRRVRALHRPVSGGRSPGRALQSQARGLRAVGVRLC